MDAKTAKSIPIPEFLATLGHEPARASGKDLWYRSPFRDESTPSFKVDPAKNVWYDHGIGEGGSIVDLSMKLFDTGVSGALKAIAGRVGAVLPAVHRERTVRAEAPKAAAESVGPLLSADLAAYLEGVRKIPLGIAREFVREVRYRAPDGRSYRAIGFPNRSGGFELRSPKFKGTLGKKDFSVVGSLEGARTVRVFEGFSDFLSAQALWPDEAGVPAVVLNSVAMAGPAAEELAASGCRADCLFDADDAGSRAFAEFRARLGERAADLRGRLSGAKDVNELLAAVRGGPQ